MVRTSRTVKSQSMKKSKVYMLILYVICLIITYKGIRSYFTAKLQLKVGENELKKGLETFSKKIEKKSAVPKPGIFFTDASHLIVNGALRLNARQACAIESAALINRNLTVYLYVFANATQTLDLMESSIFVNTLVGYKNVKIRIVTDNELVRGTIAENFFKSGKFSNTTFYAANLANVFRFLILNKYGGTYLDLDVIVKKRLDLLPSNFACRESELFVNGAVLGLEKGGKFSKIFLQELMDHYDGNVWGHNGPKSITRALKKLCKTEKVGLMTAKRCGGFNVLHPNVCYPLRSLNKTLLMIEEQSSSALKAVENSTVVHFWNKRTEQIKLKVNSTAPYVVLAKQYCPRVFAKCVSYF